MIGWLARFFLLKFLPRRILPILTLIEIVRLYRSFRRQRYAVNEPWRSRTSPPPQPALPPPTARPRR
jgi:hypothetical protein